MEVTWIPVTTVWHILKLRVELAASRDGWQQQIQQIIFFYRCTMHFDIYRVHSPTNALFIKLEKTLKFTLKFTLSSLLHVSVYDLHQGAYAGAWLKLYLC
jgi:hypothetical protein